MTPPPNNTRLKPSSDIVAFNLCCWPPNQDQNGQDSYIYFKVYNPLGTPIIPASGLLCFSPN